MSSAEACTIQRRPGKDQVNCDAKTQQLLRQAEDLHTKPLWAQMSRLNPPLPNPKCTPHVWEYAKIRPSLLQAGELITEKQAERRVLMLVNPSRGTTSITLFVDRVCL